MNVKNDQTETTGSKPLRAGRFTLEELQIRALQATRRWQLWQGPYPYRECSECFAQIHVGGISLCDDCRQWMQENKIG